MVLKLLYLHLSLYSLKETKKSSNERANKNWIKIRLICPNAKHFVPSELTEKTKKSSFLFPNQTNIHSIEKVSFEKETKHNHFGTITQAKSIPKTLIPLLFSLASHTLLKGSLIKVLISFFCFSKPSPPKSIIRSQCS